MKTYLFSGSSGYDWSSFEEILSAHGFGPYPDGEYVKDGKLLLKDGACGIKYVDFLVAEWITDRTTGGYDTNTYGISCDWHSIHLLRSIDNLRRKDLLHAALRDSKYIAKTWNMENFEYSSGTYILRPSSIMANSGIDILIAHDAESFAAAKKFYEDKISAHSKYHNKSLGYYRVIVSEYIVAPLLFRGRKFHLRLYGINFSDRSGFWIARTHGKIITAAAPFILGDFNNKDIHDTHLKNSLGDITYPDEFPRGDLIEKINGALDNLEVELSKLCTPTAQEQASRSFHVFGLDIMISENGDLFLLEINERPGFAAVYADSKFADFCARHAAWLAGFIMKN